MELNLSRIPNSFVLLAALFLCACQKSQEPAESSSRPQRIEARKVHVGRVEELPVEQTVPAQGSLAALDRAVLSAKVPGRVESILVDMGTVVQEGDVLARIEKRDYELKRLQAEAALAQARARLGLSVGGEEDKAEPEKTSIVKEARAVLAEARKNRERILKLREEGVLPEADVETAESAFQVALNRYEESTHEARNRIATLKQRQAELAQVEQQLRDTEIRAPFPGIIERRQTSPGEFLSIGTPLLTVVRVDPIRARIEVSEKDAPRVRLGQLARLHIEGSPEELKGKITRVSPVIAQGNRMLQLEADIANPEARFRPGSFVKGQVVVNQNAPGLFVPKGAVITFAGMQKIFLVRAGKAEEKEVSLGREFGTQVEVFGPVQPGEMVILNPGTLRSGQPIQIVTSDS